MRIVIVGGTGFIGRHVVAQLSESGHEVAIVHRGGTSLPGNAHVYRILGDRSSLPSLRDEFKRWRPEVAIDMILSSGGQARATLGSFRNIARRVVAISSGDVYRAMAVLHRLEDGPVEPVPLTEDSTLRTHSQTYSPEALQAARGVFPWIDEDYDKVAVERAIRLDAALPATVLRLPMVYGPGDPLHRFYPVLKRVQDGRMTIAQGESLAKWVACRGYVENVAAAIALTAVTENASGRTYNAGDVPPFTEAEWTAKIGATAGWRGRVISIAKEFAPEGMALPYNFTQHLYMDSSRIRAELGYVEPVAMEEALRRTVDWEMANPPRELNPNQYDYEAEDVALAASGHQADPSR